LSKVFGWRAGLVGLTEIKMVILIRYYRLLGVESVDKEFYFIAAGFQLRVIAVGDWSQTGQVETRD